MASLFIQIITCSNFPKKETFSKFYQIDSDNKQLESLSKHNQEINFDVWYS